MYSIIPCFVRGVFIRVFDSAFRFHRRFFQRIASRASQLLYCPASMSAHTVVRCSGISLLLTPQVLAILDLSFEAGL